mgnify:CR=1 FL=1
MKTEQQIPLNQDWRYATWEGSRQAMLERTRGWSVRQRLEAMQCLNELSLRLREMSPP